MSLVENKNKNPGKAKNPVRNWKGIKSTPVIKPWREIFTEGLKTMLYHYSSNKVWFGILKTAKSSSTPQ